MKFVLREPFVDNLAQQANNEGLLVSLNEIAQFLFFGTGAPGFTPPGRALYIRLDGGAGTTLYVWEGAAWAAK